MQWSRPCNKCHKDVDWMDGWQREDGVEAVRHRCPLCRQSFYAHPTLKQTWRSWPEAKRELKRRKIFVKYEECTEKSANQRTNDTADAMRELEISKDTAEWFDDAQNWGSENSGELYKRELMEEGSGTNALVKESLRIDDLRINQREVDYQIFVGHFLKDLTRNQERDFAKIVELTLERNKSTNFKSHTMFKSKSDIRKYYTEDARSLLRSVPVPKVSKKDEFEFVYVHPDHIVNHVLARGQSVMVLRLDKDSDWLDENGNYKCEMLKKIRESVRSQDNVPGDCRVCITIIWSDTFQVNLLLQRKEKDIEIITLSFQPNTKRERNNKLMTHPLAVGAKKEEHQTILAKVLIQLKSLEKWKFRYCGREKKLVPMSVHCTMIQQDNPERRNASQTAGVAGTYHKRFGYSCCYHDKIHSCKRCVKRRIRAVVNGTSSSEIAKPCSACADWWDSGLDCKHGRFDKPNNYPQKLDLNGPTPPSERPIAPHEKKLLPCKLTLKMMEKAFHVTVFNRYNCTWSKENAKAYLRTCCFHGKLIDVILDNVSQAQAARSVSPECFEPPDMILLREGHGMEFVHMVETLMHQTQLGVTQHLVKRYHLCIKCQVQFEKYAKVVSDHLRNIEKLSLLWCRTLAFSNTEKSPVKPPVGTVGWQASHCGGFSRMSVIYLGLITKHAEIEHQNKVPPQLLQRVGVLWYCVLSRLYGDEKSDPSLIDAYVKLFLSACVAFSDGTESDEIFFIGTTNYISLLNLPEALEMHGDELWEGLREAWLVHVKKYMPSLRMDGNSLQTVMQNILHRHYYDYLSEGNPHMAATELRNHDFKIHNNIEVLEEEVRGQKHPISGVVMADVEVHVCYKARGQIKATRLVFNDEGGAMTCNLWYSPCRTLGDHKADRTFQDRQDVLNHITDCAIVQPIEGKYAVICKSWKVRLSTGRLELMIPHKSLFPELG